LYILTNYSNEILRTDNIQCEILDNNMVSVLNENGMEIDCCVGYETLESLNEAINK